MDNNITHYDIDNIIFVVKNYIDYENILNYNKRI